MTAMTELTGSVRIWSEDTNIDPGCQHLLDSYCFLEQRYQRLRQVRTLAYVILAYSLVNFGFLLESASHYHSFWFLGSLIGIAIALPLAVYCKVALLKLLRQKKQLSRELFDAGLRVDEGNQLVTNTAHPRVVARLKGKLERE